MPRKSSSKDNRVEIHVRGKPTTHVEFCQANGIPYKLTYTTASARLVTPYQKIVFAEDRITKREFVLRNKLMKMVDESVDYVVRDPYKPTYQKFAPKLHNIAFSEQDLIEVEDVYEIDLNQAYYYAAYIMGFIDEDFFKKTLDLPKHIRLRLLGSIATVKHIEESDGEEITYDTIENQKMRDIWHNIVCHVDRVMTEMAEALGDRFIFYWVDGIYFTTFGEHDVPALVVEQIAEKNNFQVKKKKLKKIEIRKVSRYLVAHVHEYETDHTRIFTSTHKGGNIPLPRNLNPQC